MKEQSEFAKKLAAAIKGSNLEAVIKAEAEQKAEEEKKAFSKLRRRQAQLHGSKKLREAARLDREGRHIEAQKLLDSIK